jgi:hypothetical protein
MHGFYAVLLQVNRLLASGQTAAAAEQAAAAQKADVRTGTEQQQLQQLTERLQQPSATVTEALREQSGVRQELDLCMSLVRPQSLSAASNTLPSRGLLCEAL